MQAFYPGASKTDLKNFLDKAPGDSKLYKLRIEYADKIIRVEFIPYQIRNIRQLVLKEAPGLEYPWKYANRSGIENLCRELSTGQDILITKNGYLTDSSFANIVLEKDGKFMTPSQPLLYGTQREHLLNTGIITSRQIHKSSLSEFSHIILINAMMDIKTGIKIPCKHIIL